MVALTPLVEKHVTLAVGPCCVKNLDPAREQHISAAGSLGYVTQSITAPQACPPWVQKVLT